MATEMKGKCCGPTLPQKDVSGSQTITSCHFLCLHLMKCYHPPQVVQQWVDSLPEEHRGLLGDGPIASCKDIARAFKKM
jgi:hypothetical protein